MYEVLSPLGGATVGPAPVAPGITDLNGKTVCEVWNGLGRGHATFPIIRELLQKRYPDVKVIPYAEFPVQDIRGTTTEIHERAEAAAALAVQRGCDAMISGIGI
ncbi:MAG: hypothetical protein HYX92_03495 [Chloroflexi bacterium]|nr:hypothetical protein [Chloroflexota bacterium]